MSVTMGQASIRNISASYSVCFNACTVKLNLRAPALAWQMSSASSNDTAVGHGRKARWTAAQHSTFQSRNKMEAAVDSEILGIKNILLVEDDPRDVELTLAALEDQRLANKVEVVENGAEALDYLYRRGKFEM